MNAKSFVAGVVVGGLIFGATVAAARQLNVVGGVIGITSGYGAATAICTDPAGFMINGAKIEPILMPIGDSAGRVATGVTFRCP